MAGLIGPFLGFCLASLMIFPLYPEKAFVNPCCRSPCHSTQRNIGRSTARALRSFSSVSATGLPGSCIRAAPRRWVLHRGWECLYTRPCATAPPATPAFELSVWGTLSKVSADAGHLPEMGTRGNHCLRNISLPGMPGDLSPY